MASPDALLLTPPENVFASMGVRIRVVIDTAFCASYGANWRDIPLFGQLRGNPRTRTENYRPQSIHRGSVAQQGQRLSG